MRQYVLIECIVEALILDNGMVMKIIRLRK